MAKVNEVAPDVYRISVYVPEFDLQFNHFLIQDEQPLLFHTGYKRLFGEIREAVTRILDPSKIRWISFSHFESDECGALNHWLEIAPQAQAACTVVGAAVSVNDFAIRPPRAMADGEELTTGRYRFRFCSTAHLPHGWDAGVIFEETQKTLLCSDLFLHVGDVEPLTESDIVGRSRAAMTEYQKGPLAYSVPYTPLTQQILDKLAVLQPKTLATMHGSSFRGNGEQAMRDLSVALQETFGSE
ncbi:MAG: MBL fold metallo-hydrolase [Acidobacteria bacterium]|nr:MBL fold metallo-hydrolase [Acidobacteriota bacterium]